jgi:hypothetical protein
MYRPISDAEDLSPPAHGLSRLGARFEAHSPGFTIWTKPRQTIRQIVDTDPGQKVVMLAVLGGIAGSFSGTEPISGMVIGIVIGAISGLLQVYVGGFLLRWIGSWYGGEATTEEVRAAVAWALVPIIWTLALEIPVLVLMLTFSLAARITNAEIFSTIMAGTMGVLSLGLTLVHTIVSLWAFVVLVACIGEVHRFSGWKALGTVLTPAAALFLIFFCFALI